MSVGSRFFKQFAAELRRRKVLRVVTVYAVVAWILLQLAEIAFEPLGYPDWALRALIISAIVGFPVTFILAWVIDIRPEGLIFDLPLFIKNESEPRQKSKYDILLASLLVLLLVGGSAYLVNQLVEKDVDGMDIASHSPPAPVSSIAVLAFESFAEDQSTDYFAAGLADEILQLLAGVSELNVSSRTSSFQFRGQQVDVRDIAEKLGVNSVLEGTARQQDNRVRISTSLTDGTTGYNRWAQSFERSMDDIFAIQREIAQSVVNELKIVLSVDSIQHLDQQVTQSSEAYANYLQGVGRLRSSLDADVMRIASQRFQDAIRIDSEFAKAYAGLCEAHLRLYEIAKSTTDFKVAETACEQSESLDPGLNAEVALALGKLYGYRGWFDRAEEQLNRAIALNSEPVDEYIELSRIRVGQNRLTEAEDLLNRARTTKPNYWAAHEALGSFLYRNDRYSEAIQQYTTAIELAPNVATMHAAKGAAHWMNEEFDQAIASYQSSLEIKPSRQAHTNIGLLHYFEGRFEEAVDHQTKALEYAPNDYRVWGRLAEAYHQTSNQPKAVEAYSRAASLAEKNLELNSEAWRTRGFLATYLAYLGQHEEAQKQAEQSIITSNENPEAYFFQAQVMMRSGQREAAVTTLEKMIKIDSSYASLVEGEPLFKDIDVNDLN